MSVSAIILTYNEAKHIKRCVDSLISVVDKIYVMDSYSTDDTIDILSKYEIVEIKKNKFINYSKQFNYALETFNVNSEWVLRIDADEYIDSELIDFLNAKLDDIPNDVSGVFFNRYMKFMGKLLCHGGMSSYWMLRMWRNGRGRCESTWMDEHIVLSYGKTIKATGKLIDHNLNNLSWWSHKHVDYSTREAIDILSTSTNISNNKLNGRLFGSKSERIRFFKKIYNTIPLFIRPFCYFFYRYFLALGFLDGFQGFVWCVLQGFWYRFMVDAKVYEIRNKAKELNIDIKNVIKNIYGYEV